MIAIYVYVLKGERNRVFACERRREERKKEANQQMKYVCERRKRDNEE
jgi:hypothetical protein